MLLLEGGGTAQTQSTHRRSGVMECVQSPLCQKMSQSRRCSVARPACTQSLARCVQRAGLPRLLKPGADYFWLLQTAAAGTQTAWQGL